MLRDNEHRTLGDSGLAGQEVAESTAGWGPLKTTLILSPGPPATYKPTTKASGTCSLEMPVLGWGYCGEQEADTLLPPSPRVYFINSNNLMN